MALLAALVAVLMSTLDSILNSSASLVLNGFIKQPRRQVSGKRLLLFSRLLVVLFMVIAALWTPQIQRFEGIVQYFQFYLGYITMPVMVVFIGEECKKMIFAPTLRPLG